MEMQDTRRHPRKPASAALMSMILPGFGQLYNGEVNKAIWLFLTFAFLAVPGMALVALYLPGAWMMAALVAGLAMTVAVWLYGMVDAWRVASRLNAYAARPWQTGGAYMLILVLCNLIGLPLLTGYVRAHLVEPFKVPQPSMEPGVMAGDYFFADKRYGCPGCGQAVSRGDIALFAYPNDRTRIYIKRIIGLPGDRVQIRATQVSVNGNPLTRLAVRSPADIVTTEQFGGKQWQARWTGDGGALDLTVPPGQVFVLGDNRGDSADSRLFGSVPLQDIVGKARQVWFSIGPQGVRWSRLGQILE